MQSNSREKTSNLSCRVLHLCSDCTYGNAMESSKWFVKTCSDKGLIGILSSEVSQQILYVLCACPENIKIVFWQTSWTCKLRNKQMDGSPQASFIICCVLSPLHQEHATHEVSLLHLRQDMNVCDCVYIYIYVRTFCQTHSKLENGWGRNIETNSW